MPETITAIDPRRRHAQATALLPRRPRLRPGVVLVRRGPGEIQFGLQPGRAIVVADLPVGLADVAGSLAGGITTAELLAKVESHDRAALSGLLRHLADAGLLDDATDKHTGTPRGLAAEAAPLGRAGAAVEVRGDGRIAVAVAVQLAAAGVGHLRVETTGLVSADDVGTGLTSDDIGGPRADAAHRALLRANDSVHTARFTRRRPDLVLLTDAVVPDPAALTALMDRRVRHLPVRIRGGVGLVGPLVVPGTTACLTCVDHHRVDRDPGWPGIAAQLVGRAQIADLPTVHATAALAATQALEALSRTDPPTWNRTLEIDPAAGTLRHRPWSPHPWCGCRASERAHTAIGCATGAGQGTIVT
ncbi:MAG TPA: TOMM precursor leader peptide-binding protein [Actinokineospora sp.]|nr:TOMM precursor leader peptide-binding protein [Actinokineospora sp.]